MVDRDAPLRFLRTAYQPDDWVAVFLKSYETGRSTQRVGPVSLIANRRFQAWLKAQNASRSNIYVAWNWGGCLLLSWRQFASCSHGPASVSEKEVLMHERDIRWDQYPAVAVDPTARAW